ncbi:hypothetical protein PTKIN_Ptkin19aG0115700 [Pterospermum kingtungense]
MKEVSSQQKHVQLMTEGSVLKESILQSSNVPLSKDSPQTYASNLVHGENLQPAACPVVGNVGNSNIENSTIATSAKDGDCNETSKNVKAIRSPDKLVYNSSQVGDVSSKNRSDKSLTDKEDDGSQKIASESPLSIRNGSLETKASEYAPFARWDDNGFTSPVQTIEANGRESITIGHVLDEWDEEYDRGKRKKIRRHKHEFGGPNLFQQIATKITQLKKAKLDHSNSENRPFSI